MLALHMYVQDPRTREPQKLQAAIKRGQTWLIKSHIDAKARWKDSTENPRGQLSIGLSGLVMHCLHRTLSPAADLSAELAKLDELWVKELPPLKYPTSGNISQIPFEGKLKDSTTNLDMPWSIIATADIYTVENVKERGRFDWWLKRMVRSIDENLSNDTRTSILGELYFKKAELLISLRYMIGENII